jgi:hypothetical protein
LKGNPAVRLYARMGFRLVAEADLTITLLWRPNPVAK